MPFSVLKYFSLEDVSFTYLFAFNLKVRGPGILCLSKPNF